MSKKIINLLNIKNGSHIVVPEYLKEEYLAQKYIVLPKNTFLKKFYIFFSINILRKIIIILNFIKKTKIIILFYQRD